MKASDLDGLFRVLRKHKVQAFEMADVKVSFHPLAMAEDVPAAARRKGRRDAEPVLPDNEMLLDGDDPDLAWSAEN